MLWFGKKDNQVKIKEERIKPSFMRLSFEGVLMLFFFSLFMLSVLYINKPRFVYITITSVGVLTIPTGMLLGMVLSTDFRVKILRRITKKNLGFIKFVYGGVVIKRILANLDKDLITFADGKYFVEKGRIKREVKEGVSDRPLKEIEPEFKFEEGIPVIYFDVDDSLPIDFETVVKKQSETDYRNPQQISATLTKEIAVEKAKAMKQQRRQLNIMLIVIIIGIATVGYLQYKTMDSLNKLSRPSIDPTQLENIISEIRGVSSRVETLNTKVDTLPQDIVKQATS